MSGHLIIKMMQWLRDLYFTCNLNRSTGIVNSILQLEYHETACARGYIHELNALGADVSEQKDIHRKNIEEMSDLNNLSAFVSKRMAARQAARMRTREATVSLKAEKCREEVER